MTKEIKQKAWIDIVLKRVESCDIPQAIKDANLAIKAFDETFNEEFGYYIGQADLPINCTKSRSKISD